MPKRSTRSKERFARITVEVMQSPAWRWMPDFARVVIVGLAGQFTGYNNGGLEFTEQQASEVGISKNPLYTGLRLAVHAGLIKRTMPARRQCGKGIPAKYALTWEKLADFPGLNISPTNGPSDEWRSFPEEIEPLKSRRKADEFLKILNGKIKPPTQDS